MKAAPTWFGPPERPLLGHVHLPEVGRWPGESWSCAIPSDGRRPTPSPPCRRWPTSSPKTGWRQCGSPTPAPATRPATSTTHDRLSDWLASIDQAVWFARHSTEGPVVLLGMRMGALLAIEAVEPGHHRRPPRRLGPVEIRSRVPPRRAHVAGHRLRGRTGRGRVGDRPGLHLFGGDGGRVVAADAWPPPTSRRSDRALVAVRSESRGLGRRKTTARPRRTWIGSRWTGSPTSSTSRPS